MRIGFDISPITRTRTGVGVFCYYLLKHLVQQGPECSFAGFSSGRYQVDLGPLRDTVPHRHIPVPTRVLYKVWTAFGIPKVDTLLGGVDVYHATNFFLPPTKTARSVVSIYDLSFLAVPELCSPKIVRPFSTGVRRFAAEADAVLACSEATKSDIVNRLDVEAAKVTVTPGAVDEGFAPMEREGAKAHVAKHYGINAPFLLFVGALEPRKNVPGLLRAFALVAKDIPHNLVLVGPLGWNPRGLFETLEALDLGERVVRIGYVASHAELPAFYCAADAFVFPTFYEGFGLPLLEALTCGCPVVTSENSSVPEATGGAAVYADPTDVESIANGIRQVLEDAALRESLIARGLEHARRFSWHACARTTLEVYRRLAPC